MIDKYVGRDTHFDVFAVNRESGFLKSIVVQDRRGDPYRGIHDAMASYNILSVYQVPFHSVRVSFYGFPYDFFLPFSSPFEIVNLGG